MSGVTHEVTWTVPARPDEAAPLRRMVVAHAAAHGMAARRLSELALAVGEALANAVVHAYRDQPAGTVEVTSRLSDGLLVITVSDRGGGLVPREDSPGMGLGLPMISQIVDDLRISEPEGGGTELRMSFTMPAEPIPLARAEGSAA